MLLFASTLLAGCATGMRTRAGDLPPRAPSAPLPEPVQAVFDRHSAGPAPLSTSPWGRDVVVVLGETYAAASGRDCRTFAVRSGNGLRPGLACRRDDQTWAEVRILHHHGRPVMEGST